MSVIKSVILPILLGFAFLEIPEFKKFSLYVFFRILDFFANRKYTSNIFQWLSKKAYKDSFITKIRFLPIKLMGV